MTLISLSDVAVEFGATTILHDVTFTVAAGDRWGIVGRNGAGKTTLFRLIAGTLAPTKGAVARQQGLRIALLDQFRDFGDANTVWEAAALGYGDLIALEESLHRQGERLAELGERISPADLDRYGRDQERFARDGGYELHARVDAVLQGLGFDPEEAKTRPQAGLSGGERGRIGLAAQLAAPADIVLLDEPTNHLDLETIDWLREYLAGFGETVLVISHDRAFLDDAVDHVLHVTAGSVNAYRGGYSSFVAQRAERELVLERQVADQRRKIAREEDYIRRNIAGQNTAQAKGRRKKLDRLPRLSPPPSEDDAMFVRFEISARGGDQALVAKDVTVAIGERVLVNRFTSVARRGDVIALVGPNGAGKTTLLTALLGDREPQTGEARLGGGITVDWFRQDLAQLPANASLYDCIAELRPMWTRGAIMNHLGTFGFSGDEVERSTANLSGGEKARAALARMMLSRANLLVLDEPTNHLDVESVESLEDALERYEGTVILVSHDRAFLRELSTRVWAFHGTKIEDYDGPFVEWEAAMKDRAAARSRADAEAAAVARETAKARKRAEAAKPAQKETKKPKLVQRVDHERAVAACEARVAELEAKLADPTLYDASGKVARRAKELGAEHAAAKRALEVALEQWAASDQRPETRDQR